MRFVNQILKQLQMLRLPRMSAKRAATAVFRSFFQRRLKAVLVTAVLPIGENTAADLMAAKSRSCRQIAKPKSL